MAIRIVCDPPGCAEVLVSNASIIDTTRGGLHYSGRNLRISATVFNGYRFRGFSIVTHYETHRGRSEDFIEQRDENPAVGSFDTSTAPYEYEATSGGEFNDRSEVTEVRIHCDISYKVRLSVSPQKAVEKGCEVEVLGERGTDVDGVYWLQAGQGVYFTMTGYGVKGRKCIAFKEGDTKLPLSGRAGYDAHCTINEDNITAPVSRSIVAVFGHNLGTSGLPLHHPDGVIVCRSEDGVVLCEPGGI